MLLQIVKYPHPTLRHKSQPVRRVDAELRDAIRTMFELMYEAQGIGLAANQVDLPLRLFVVNLSAEHEAETEQVFINPVISHPQDHAEQEEGCLSLPGLYGPVRRPRKVRVEAYGLSGAHIVADLDGLPARVVQHELDHLDGTLFIDRMDSRAQEELEAGLAAFETEFLQLREAGEIPPDDQVQARLLELQVKYC
ncbi:MAG TPA: peptide deformylase [Planctomycetaceae bacterium]|nr:peptide deformylase [Planctomycetaceae bacterium]